MCVGNHLSADAVKKAVERAQSETWITQWSRWMAGLSAAAGGVAAWLAAAEVGPMAYLGVFVFVIFGWLISLCLHEFAHAVTAFRFGDRSVQQSGYLTLNPLKYTHPGLSLGLPLLIILLGGIGFF